MKAHGNESMVFKAALLVVCLVKDMRLKRLDGSKKDFGDKLVWIVCCDGEWVGRSAKC